MAAVDSVVSAVTEKFIGLLVEEAKFLSGVRNEVEWIKAELRAMQCFLTDAEEKQGVNANVKNWIADLRDVAYDAEDIVDTLILRKERKKNANPIKRYASIFSGRDLIACHKVGIDIGQIRTRLLNISRRQMLYGIENLEANGEASSSAIERLRERRTFPHFEKHDAIGLEEDLEMLKLRLFEDDLNRRFVSIVGMGGIGKTTLAKKVYNNTDVIHHFGYRVWITVSQAHSAKGLLDDIWKQVIADTSADHLNIQQMAQKLFGVLKEKKYLIVMDDVWDVRAWDEVEVAFPNSKNGSRVLLTTRNSEVALKVQADRNSSLHNLKLLSEEKSLELFLKKVGIEEGDCPPNLVDLGKKIVNKCGRLPLAIVVLGGVLSSKEVRYDAWLRVFRRVSWQLMHDESNSWSCSYILSLSYIDLPRYLKPCFIYLGLFPEDYEISRRRLIGLWLAEGLVQHRDNEPLEDVAEEYIEELIDRSMIQVAERRLDGKLKTCRMHDLLRDLAFLKAEENNFFHIYGHGELTSTNEGSTSTEKVNIRRLAEHNTIYKCPSSTDHIRSYLAFHKEDDSEVEEFGSEVEEDDSKVEVSMFLQNGIRKKGLRLLRVIDLEGVRIPQLPEALGQLIHLRYLGLRRTNSRSLPSSLDNLRNLQTLDVKYCKYSGSNYLKIWKLQQLRHLYMNGLLGNYLKIGHPPVRGLSSSSFNFINLRSLMGLYIDELTPINCGLDKCLHLKELVVLGKLSSQQEALFNWLVKLDRLELLKLKSITEGGGLDRLPTMMQFSNRHLYNLSLEGKFAGKLLEVVHEFPPNLTMLTLMWCLLEEDPFPTLEKLPNLRTLRLSHNAYWGKKLVCSSGGFRELQQLELRELHGLEFWEVEEGAMQNLKRLVFYFCSALKMIPDGLQHITTLQELRLRRMSPQFTTRIETNGGEDSYKIKHIPSIRIEEY